MLLCSKRHVKAVRKAAEQGAYESVARLKNQSVGGTKVVKTPLFGNVHCKGHLYAAQ